MAGVERRWRAAAPPRARDIANLYDIARFKTVALLNIADRDHRRIGGGRILSSLIGCGGNRSHLANHYVRGRFFPTALWV